jgi:multidrug efflux pump subunit AcrA (membrane-fusion protein)
MSIKPRWIAPVAVALALAAPLKAMGDNGATALPTAPVTVIAAGEATSFDGVVEAVRQTVLAAQVAGSVVALDALAGSRVKARLRSTGPRRSSRPRRPGLRPSSLLPAPR